MFQPGDRVIYGMHGVCDILELQMRLVDRKQVEYYVLVPVEQPETRYFIPTQNQAAVSKLKPIITREELDMLLQSAKDDDISWIQDEGLRKQRYRELISCGDRAELIRMVRMLHAHRNHQQALGKKPHLCDENFLRDAQKLLNSEFSLTLRIPQEEVSGYVKKILGD